MNRILFVMNGLNPLNDMLAYFKKDAGIEVLCENINVADVSNIVVNAKPELIYLDSSLGEGSCNLILVTFDKPVRSASLIVEPDSAAVKKALVKDKVFNLVYPGLLSFKSDFSGANDNFAFKVGGKWYFLKRTKIKAIKSHRNVILLLYGKEFIKIPASMISFIEQHSLNQLFKSSRSLYINIDLIKSIKKWRENNYEVEFADGENLVIGKKEGINIINYARGE